MRKYYVTTHRTFPYYYSRVVDSQRHFYSPQKAQKEVPKKYYSNKNFSYKYQVWKKFRIEKETKKNEKANSVMCTFGISSKYLIHLYNIKYMHIFVRYTEIVL